MRKCATAGFTLVELLVVFAVTGLLSAIGIAAFSTYSQQQLVSQAGAELKNNLRLAQGKTLSQEVPNACSVGRRPLVGYEVQFTSNRQYTILPRCGDVLEPAIKTVNLSNSLTLSKTPSGPILFKVLTGGVVGAGTITVSGFNRSQVITVTVTGSIY